jgi:hypothetical protein
MHIYHRNKIYLTILYRFFTWLYICITVISAMWNFWGFGLKRRHLIFADFVSCWLKIAAPKKICLYYRNQQLKRCYDKQLVQITVTLRSKNILCSLKSFQTLQYLNTHLVNFKFVFRNYFFTVFSIYFVDRKYEVNSWIDIGIKFDIFRI